VEQRGLLGLERVEACLRRWIVWFAHLFDKPVGQIARRIGTHALSFLSCFSLASETMATTPTAPNSDFNAYHRC
jgi:hypothetical protein